LGQLENSKETPSDLFKGLCEWALAAGRFFQSAQTGFVHLYYGESEPRAQTIPIVENALFILALFRSRLVEQVQEGKGLLKRLVAFQKQHIGDDFGNFPVYLHEYPVCQDPALGIQLLAPFYWILKQFGHILGPELKQQLKHAAHLVLEHSMRAQRTKNFPYSLATRLASAQLAYGLLWNKEELHQTGKEQLEQLAQRQLEGWHTTRHLADILVGLQMVYPSLSASPWSSLWLMMEQTWHPSLACYIGPCVREWQEREEPQVNLYDLFGGFFSGKFSRRASLLSYHHLHGILIQPSLDQFHYKSSPYIVEGKLKQQTWRTVYHPDWYYNLLEKNGPHQPTVDKTHTPYRFVWGDYHRLHSLVCQGGNIEKIEYLEDGSIILLFDLRDQPAEEESAPKREIEFFADFHPDIQFHLNGHAATTFELGQTFQLLFKKYCLSLTFELLQGEGNFLGHVMRSNRPSQVDVKGEKRFQAYDWNFFLRTIRRQGHCKLQVRIMFEIVKDFQG
jgi:hypothetical protein